ncbi:MAG: hypothetical protein K0S42_3072 [Microvirga sp.]|jgi:hypothetical protein|nr:hypothetical protein [Microvirga sp.]
MTFRRVAFGTLGLAVLLWAAIALLAALAPA